MLSAENIQSMKQNNISKDSELTKQRVKECLRTASSTQKGEIDALAGLKRVSINRVYATGRISPKIAVAIAQVLNINPSYLTGETDKKGECNDLILDAFLIENGYSNLSKLSASVKKSRAKKGEKKTVVTEVQPVKVESDAKKDAEKPSAPSVQEIQGVEHGFSVKPDKEDSRPHWELTEEEAIQLLRSLYLRVQFDPNGDVAGTLERIQMLLI